MEPKELKELLLKDVSPNDIQPKTKNKSISKKSFDELFKYDFYIKEANPEGVAELLPILKEFYSRYPTGNEVGEALHQLRREFNLIEEVAKKKQRIKALEDELDDLDA